MLSSLRILKFTQNRCNLFKTTTRNKSKSVVPLEHFDDICLQNEPVLEYKPGSEEMKNLEAALECAASKCEEIPIVVDGKDFQTKDVHYQVMPHRHKHKIAKYYYADERIIWKAISAAIIAQQKWDRTSICERIDIWERAADLMATKYRAELVATTMLGQSKTVVQGEIDAAAELIDFIRMHAAYLKQAVNYRPISADKSVTTNHFRYRGIDGFIAAISPFNFTAIAGNLAYTPALMGNGVVWKPSDTAILSNWKIFNIMREAGVPDGLVNFVPCDGPSFGKIIARSEELAGVNFTGSVPTFQTIWRLIGDQIRIFFNFPRLIGECGGKNFHFVHPSADVETVVACTIRAAFEYSGQKCSACSRIYVPESLWECKIMSPLVEKTEKLVVGDVTELESFTSAVIDERAFERITKYIDYAKKSDEVEVIAGGKYNNLKGYFIRPTIAVVESPRDRLMTEEIFGPFLAVYVYKDSDVKKAMELVTKSTKYALTGAVFAKDEAFLKEATIKFKDAAGNFYINDKCTGSVVGQQPFGGGRMSGTNDKAGGPHYILRWASPQSIKETFVPMTDINYPYMPKCE